MLHANASQNTLECRKIQIITQLYGYNADVFSVKIVLMKSFKNSFSRPLKS